MAVTFGSLSKGITGIGLPMIGVPILATFFGVEQAVIIMAVPTFLTNVWLMVEHRRQFAATRDLPVLVVLGFAGTVLGTVFLTRVDPAIPAIILGALILAYLGQRLVRPSMSFREEVTRRTSPFVGFAGGALQGTTGVSGPIIATYIHGFGLRREAFILSITTVFQSYALVQVATFAALGRFDATNLLLAGVALVPILVALPVGIRLGRRLDARRFEQLLMAILVVSSAKLLFDGVRGLI